MPNKHTRIRSMIQTVVTLVLVYGLYCGVLFLLQRYVMYPGAGMAPPLSEPPDVAGLERVFLDTPGGRVEVWYVPPATDNGSGPAPVAICAHGNGEFIDMWPFEFAELPAMGVGLVLVEYPGFGRSGGSPSQDAITSAFVAAHDWATARPDVDAGRVVLLGRSLGGGAVCRLATRRPSAAMILISTFTSARSFAIRYLAPPFLVRDPFDNLSAVRDYENPLLVIHGSRDGIIPFRHGRRLAEAAPDGRLIQYPDGHNDLPTDGPRFWRDLRSFLRETEILPPADDPSGDAHRPPGRRNG